MRPPGRCSRPSSPPRGYLVHALQTTLWTFSLLFKSPPGEGGRKIQRRSESIGKKKISKGCPQRQKSPDSADLQTTTRLSGESGETTSHPDLTRNQAPSATFPLLQAERTPVYTGGPLPGAGQTLRPFMATPHQPAALLLHTVPLVLEKGASVADGGQAPLPNSCSAWQITASLHCSDQ